MKKLAKLALTITLLIGVFWFFDIPVASVYTNVSDWRYFVMAMVLRLTLVPLFAVSRWRFILRLSGVEERLSTLWAINLKSLFMGLFLPSAQGADVCRIAMIEKRHPDRSGVVGSTVFIERIIGFALLALWALAALPVLHDNAQFSAVAAMVALMNLAVFGVLSLLYLSRRLSISGYADAGFIGRVISYFGRFHGAVVRFPYRRGLLMTLVFIGGTQLSVIVIVYLLFHAMDHPLALVQHLLFYPLIGALMIVPVTVGGFGVREGAFVWFYSLVSVSADVAVAVSVATYVVVTFVPALAGGVLLLWSSMTGADERVPS